MAICNICLSGVGIATYSKVIHTGKKNRRCSKLNYSGLESERKSSMAVSSWGPANKTAHIPECVLGL